jgi:hypothetical protein
MPVAFPFVLPRAALLWAAGLLIAGDARAGDLPPPPLPLLADTSASPALRLERLAVVVGVPVALSARELDHRRRTWWRGKNVRFRVEEDWSSSLGSDKLVHVFAAASAARALRAGLAWSGVPEQEAQLLGALGGWAQLMYLEVLDGFGPNWGFSPSDALSNTIGAAFAYAQWQVPALETFELKVGYWPSGQSGRRLAADHAGMTWWATATPSRLGAPTPPWLAVAVGYGARRGEGTRDFTEAEVLVGFDLDLRGLPIDHPVWHALVGVARYVRIPAPAVRLSPRPALVPLAY